MWRFQRCPCIGSSPRLFPAPPAFVRRRSSQSSRLVEFRDRCALRPPGRRLFQHPAIHERWRIGLPASEIRIVARISTGLAAPRAPSSGLPPASGSLTQDCRQAPPSSNWLAGFFDGPGGLSGRRSECAGDLHPGSPERERVRQMEDDSSHRRHDPDAAPRSWSRIVAA